MVAVAASTGGPAALQVLLKDLPADLPVGLVIVQHMSEGFTEALAARLNTISPLQIRVSAGLEPIQPGLALLAPPGVHLIVRRIAGKIYAALTPEPSHTLHRPSADVLFSSVAKTCGPAACAVIMTGMGDDGARGMKEIRGQGGWTIAQDEASSTIFGMPKAAIAESGVDLIVPLERIAKEIVRAL